MGCVMCEGVCETNKEGDQSSITKEMSASASNKMSTDETSEVNGVKHYLDVCYV